mmetsp:Transcript_25471/g.66167  ORF Transcript_25471/g.66167 Transcript_25471/m.66167 type:complete len:762 (+) Transcript_25471:158-2443(+)
MRRLALLLLLLQHVTAFERIACLGDSIVRGDTKHEEEDEWEDGKFDRGNYPAILEDLIDGSTTCANFGASGVCVDPDAKFYLNSDRFDAAIDFDPDLVVIMIGVNDAKQKLDIDDYEGGYEQILSKMEDKMKNLQEIYIVIPFNIIGTCCDIDMERYNDEVSVATLNFCLSQQPSYKGIPITCLDIRDEWNARTGCGSCAHSGGYDACSDECWSFYDPDDGIHTDDSGSQLLAELIYEALPNMPSRAPTPSPPPTPQPSYAPVPFPTPRPTKVPKPQPTRLPTAAPSPAPVYQPSPSPSKVPIPAPTVTPGEPSAKPTPSPSPAPSPRPTSQPSPRPTHAPSAKPSLNPTVAPGNPTAAPFPAPSLKPTSPKTTASPTFVEIATGTLTLRGIDSATALQQKDAIAASIAALFAGDRVAVTILVLERRRLQATDEATVVFTVTAPLSANEISTTLTEAQASGALDANLKERGVDATTASVAMDGAQDDSKDSPSTAGADMNIVLAICFICVGLVGATGVLMYWRGMKRKRAAQPYKNAKALPDASSPFKNPKSPSPRDGERVSLRSGLAATVDVEGLDVMETTVAVSSSVITTSDMDQLDQLTDALEPPGAPPMSPQQRPFHSPSQKARKHRPAEAPSELELPSGRDATPIPVRRIKLGPIGPPPPPPPPPPPERPSLLASLSQKASFFLLGDASESSESAAEVTVTSSPPAPPPPPSTPGGTSLSADTKGRWACPKCAMVNAAGTALCASCDEPRITGLAL